MLSGMLGTEFATAPWARASKASVSDNVIRQQSATRDNFLALLRCRARGKPALLFRIARARVDRDRSRHSAEIPGRARHLRMVARVAVARGSSSPERRARDADLVGTMCFLFACFGGACPANDSYQLTPAGDPLPLAPKPFIASLPQRLLRAGALAVLAHSDRAWTYGFVSGSGVRQDQLIRGAVEGLMAGVPAGRCADQFQEQWGALSAQLGLRLDYKRNKTQPVSKETLANLAIARDDARNYLVLGDPAARVRVKDMA
jgi:hypothetical protein